jgi:hypothetical protein
VLSIRFRAIGGRDNEVCHCEGSRADFWGIWKGKGRKQCTKPVAHKLPNVTADLKCKGMEEEVEEKDERTGGREELDKCAT